MKKFLQFVSVSGVVLGLVGTSASVSSVARGGGSKGKRPVIIVTSKSKGEDVKNTGLSVTQRLLVALGVLAVLGTATYTLANSSDETKKKVGEHYVSFRLISDVGLDLIRWVDAICRLLDTRSAGNRAY